MPHVAQAWGAFQRCRPSRCACVAGINREALVAAGVCACPHPGAHPPSMLSPLPRVDCQANDRCSGAMSTRAHAAASEACSKKAACGALLVQWSVGLRASRSRTGAVPPSAQPSPLLPLVTRRRPRYRESCAGWSCLAARRRCRGVGGSSAAAAATGRPGQFARRKLGRYGMPVSGCIQARARKAAEATPFGNAVGLV